MAEVQNRAPCLNCGIGLVACSKPSDPERIYWRHDQQNRVLNDDGGGRWRLAAEQYGAAAAIYRANVADLVRDHRA